MDIAAWIEPALDAKVPSNETQEIEAVPMAYVVSIQSKVVRWLLRCHFVLARVETVETMVLVAHFNRLASPQTVASHATERQVSKSDFVFGRAPGRLDSVNMK